MCVYLCDDFLERSVYVRCAEVCVYLSMMPLQSDVCVSAASGWAVSCVSSSCAGSGYDAVMMQDMMI